MFLKYELNGIKLNANKSHLYRTLSPATREVLSVCSYGRTHFTFLIYVRCSICLSFLFWIFCWFVHTIKTSFTQRFGTLHTKPICLYSNLLPCHKVFFTHFCYQVRREEYKSLTIWTKPKTSLAKLHRDSKQSTTHSWSVSVCLSTFFSSLPQVFLRLFSLFVWYHLLHK